MAHDIDLHNSQSSLTGESGSTEKTADIREPPSTPLLDLKNICFMVSLNSFFVFFSFYNVRMVMEYKKESCPPYGT